MLTTLLQICGGILFIVIAALAWMVFTCWLHDTKRGFSESWTLSAAVGLALACVWPLSLTLLFFYENISKLADKIEDH